jgi:hypothetical protein
METIVRFIENSGLSRAALLKLLKKWRRLQSGGSDKKAAAYSGEG